MVSPRHDVNKVGQLYWLNLCDHVIVKSADDLLAEIRQTRAQIDALRKRLFQLIREAAGAGARVKDMQDASGFSREYVAQIRDGRADAGQGRRRRRAADAE